MRVHLARGTRDMSWASTFSGSSPRARPSRLVTRSTWVSTAMPSLMPNAWPSTTLAVFRPDSGQLAHRLDAAWKLAAVLADEPSGEAEDAARLGPEEAGGADERLDLGRGGLGQRRGVGKRANRPGVTMLTRSSVH